MKSLQQSINESNDEPLPKEFWKHQKNLNVEFSNLTVVRGVKAKAPLWKQLKKIGDELERLHRIATNYT